VTLAVALPPTPAQVAIGILAVLAGALTASVSVFLAQRSHNWLHGIAALGGLLIVAGVVGQRTATDAAGFGPWDAGIAVPVVGIHVDVLTAAGVVLCLVGLTLTLLFERVPSDGEVSRPLVHRALEDDDAV
jgi:hypothetical protein